MDFTSAAAQVRSIHIFAVATITALIAAALIDRFRHRYTFCMIGLIIPSIGYTLLLCRKHLLMGVKYFAFSLLCLEDILRSQLL